MSIPHGAVAGAMLLRQLHRRCPQCGKEITITAARKNETVECTSCGAKVPPKKNT